MTELLDNKGVGHVHKYSCLLQPNIRKPSEQHEEKGRDGMDNQKQREESGAESSSEESDGEDTGPWIPDYPDGFCVKKFCFPEKSAWVSSWFDVCGRTTEDYDEKIRKYVSEVANGVQGRKFVIQADGYCGIDKNPGYGAIIYDNRCKPIIAESKVLPEGERVSPFYHELQGVNLGLELAIHYGLLNFQFHCTSPDIVRFLTDCLIRRKKCSSCMENSEIEFQVCDVCFRSRLPVHQKANEERILPVIQDFITKVSKLESLGHPCHLLRFTEDLRRIKVADWLAKVGLNKKMKPHEIEEDVELTELIFSEAVRRHKILGCIF
ncbi:hypothetical protein MKW94_025736 [Papaver nudicaule]|uniref:Uncharacterized protein n=1 Tax=Papaver nudicaule TaxID=74823 RepID=A0AA41RQS3_PAPNU|nr:hypothetical protein [Papaver nudicaule]